MIRVRCLKACRRIILGREVLYRLLKVRGKNAAYFAINVSMENESKTCGFGKARAKAVSIYKKIVLNEVTPCSLADIAEDFAKTE